MSYNEEIEEAVLANKDYLEDVRVEDVIAFLEGMGESLSNGEVFEQVAEALRDAWEGVI